MKRTRGKRVGVAAGWIAGSVAVVGLFVAGSYWTGAGGFEDPSKATCLTLGAVGVGDCAWVGPTSRNLEIAYERAGIDGK